MFRQAAKAPYLAMNQIDFVASDTVIGDQRRVVMGIHAGKSAKRIELFTPDIEMIDSLKIFDQWMVRGEATETLFRKRLSNRLIGYFLTDGEPLQAELVFHKDSVPELQIYAGSYDLLDQEQLKVPAREDWMMPKPFVLNDAVMTKRTVRLDSLMDYEIVE
jgi:hypothetical protein